MTGQKTIAIGRGVTDVARRPAPRAAPPVVAAGRCRGWSTGGSFADRGMPAESPDWVQRTLPGQIPVSPQFFRELWPFGYPLRDICSAHLADSSQLLLQKMFRHRPVSCGPNSSECRANSNRATYSYSAPALRARNDPSPSDCVDVQGHLAAIALFARRRRFRDRSCNPPRSSRTALRTRDRQCLRPACRPTERGDRRLAPARAALVRRAGARDAASCVSSAPRCRRGAATSSTARTRTRPWTSASASMAARSASSGADASSACTSSPNRAPPGRCGPASIDRSHDRELRSGGAGVAPLGGRLVEQTALRSNGVAAGCGRGNQPGAFFRRRRPFGRRADGSDALRALVQSLFAVGPPRAVVAKAFRDDRGPARPS